VLRPAAEPLIQPGRPYARRAVGERHEPRRAARPLKLTPTNSSDRRSCRGDERAFPRPRSWT
jgi:hypothetical protein